MANLIRRSLGEFVHSNTSFLRVIRRNMNYDYQHRPAFFLVKLVLGIKILYTGFNGIGYNEWLDARRKENSEEARLDRSKRVESATTHLKMLEREVKTIKGKPIHARADENKKAVPVCSATS